MRMGFHQGHKCVPSSWENTSFRRSRVEVEVRDVRDALINIWLISDRSVRGWLQLRCTTSMHVRALLGEPHICRLLIENQSILCCLVCCGLVESRAIITRHFLLLAWKQIIPESQSCPNQYSVSFAYTMFGNPHILPGYTYGQRCKLTTNQINFQDGKIRGPNGRTLTSILNFWSVRTD